MIVAILQTRMSSTRLPGKALLPLLGESVLARQVERVRRASSIDEIVVATSLDATDGPIEQECRRIGVRCHRGSLADVLDRFRGAAEALGADHIVRLTGDCPLSDPDVIDLVVRAHLAAGADYTSNVRPPSFPDGLDVEVMTRGALERAWREADLPSDREHVTGYLWREPGRFRVHNVLAEVDRSDSRWTLDEPEDFAFISAVFERLYPTSPAFGWSDVLALLDAEPSLAEINAHHVRDAGAATSAAADAAYLATKEDTP